MRAKPLTDVVVGEETLSATARAMGKAFALAEWIEMLHFRPGQDDDQGEAAQALCQIVKDQEDGLFETNGKGCVRSRSKGPPAAAAGSTDWRQG